MTTATNLNATPLTKPKRVTRPPQKRPIKINALAVAKVMKSLLDGPCSINELRDVSGLGLNTISRYLNAMVKEKCVHVSAWEKDSMGRDALRVFSLGYGVTAKKTRKSKVQLAAERIARRRVKAMNAAFAAVHVKELKLHESNCTGLSC